MLLPNMITEEQFRKINHFLNFYNDKTIDAYRESYREQKAKVRREPYYRAYLNIVYETAEVLKRIGINDPLTASVAFEYLLWNGFFSKDHKLVYSISNRINNTAITGADIMRGKSVCLNNAEMLSRVLRNMQLDGYLMGCNLNPHKDQKMGYRPPIKRRVEKADLKDRFLSKIIDATIMRKIGNHAVVVSKDNNAYFMIDPTSLAFANTRDIFKARYVDSDIEIDLKPWLMLIAGDIKPDKFREITAGMIFQGEYDLLDVSKIKGISSSTIEQCKDNRLLLGHFHEQITLDIEIVSKTLKKVK